MVLRELRKIYKISMQELADAIGVSKQLIGQIEKGNRIITDDVLNKLVEYFGLNKNLPNDYRGFLLKDKMDDIEDSKVRIVKINKEVEEIETEVTDPDTGEKYISHHRIIDESDYIIRKYKLSKAMLTKKIEGRLSGIIENCMKEQEDNYGVTSVSYEKALLEAEAKVNFFEEIINLDSKADQNIFSKVVRALSIATNGGFDSDIFTNNLVELIRKEMKPVATQKSLQR
ncbi:helix-turn-helix domain-containing protein [Desulfosporosinus fructosivorans]|nr:helix-turn-helix transcriptional regulator [Desulfosporosinus fructosivorans]